MLSLTVVVDALLVAWLVTIAHCASLSSVNLGRDAWLEDFENMARQVKTDRFHFLVTVNSLRFVEVLSNPY